VIGKRTKGLRRKAKCYPTQIMRKCTKCAKCSVFYNFLSLGSISNLKIIAPKILLLLSKIWGTVSVFLRKLILLFIKDTLIKSNRFRFFFFNSGLSIHERSLKEK